MTARPLPKPGRRGTRWTLLFVGDHGRTVPVKRFKGLLYLAAVVLLVALGTAAGLYLVNRHTIGENRRLVDEVALLGEEVSDLRYEKDVLTARLVLTEAELRHQGEAESPPAPSEAPAPTKEPAVEADETEAPPEAAQEAPPSPEPATVEEIAVVPEPASGQGAYPEAASTGEAVIRPVSVEDLAVAHEQDRSLFRVTFVIRKGDPQPESVSGHAFVVLKPEGVSTSDNWISMPWAHFSAGRPNPPRRGQFFSISRFKPMKFETKGVANPDRFAQLTVFVFDTRGQLLLQQDFNLSNGTAEAG